MFTADRWVNASKSRKAAAGTISPRGFNISIRQETSILPLPCIVQMSGSFLCLQLHDCASALAVSPKAQSYFHFVVQWLGRSIG